MCTIHQCGSPTTCNISQPCVHEESDFEKAFRSAKKVCMVGVGILAAVAAPWLFVPSFAVGMVIGILTYKKTEGNGHRHRHGPSCSHGVIEDATEVRLPEALSFLAGTAALAVHIDHHESVFVPIVGLSLGVWAGSLAAPSINLWCRKFVDWASESFPFNSKNLVSIY